jgi:hypothetical protein
MRYPEGHKQLLGGHLEMPGNNPAVRWVPMFEGNLEERGSDESDSGLGYGGQAVQAADATHGITVTINRSITLSNAGLATIILSQARITWGAGRGGAGNNSVIVDVGAGGTTFFLGATNYLKVEILHVVIGTAVAPAVFDLSWVVNYGGAKSPAYCTSIVGTVAATSISRQIQVPAYAMKGWLLGDGPPALGDSIEFRLQGYPTATLFYRQLNVAFVPIPVAAGAEFFDVVNSTSAPANYTVLWELRQ